MENVCNCIYGKVFMIGMGSIRNPAKSWSNRHGSYDINVAGMKYLDAERHHCNYKQISYTSRE